VVGTAGFEPATPCSQSRCADQAAPRPVQTATDLRFLLLGAVEAASIALQHHLTGVLLSRHVGAKATRPGPLLRAASPGREQVRSHGRDLPGSRWRSWPPGARKATAERATGHRPPPIRMPTAPATVNRAMVGRGHALTSERHQGTNVVTSTAHHHENQAACLRCWTSGRCDGRAPRCRSWSRGRVPVGALLSELLAAESHSPIH
jgi:hypothetical protein